MVDKITAAIRSNAIHFGVPIPQLSAFVSQEYVGQLLNESELCFAQDNKIIFPNRGIHCSIVKDLKVDYFIAPSSAVIDAIGLYMKFGGVSSITGQKARKITVPIGPLLEIHVPTEVIEHHLQGVGR